MTPEHGTRARYKAGCVCVECRVANAAYMVVYRAQVRMEHARLGAVVNGHQTARMIRTFKSEGYRPGVIWRLVGLSKRTIERHCRSRPVTRRTLQLVVSAWRKLDSEETSLDPQRQADADAMLHNLGKGLTTDAGAWQALKSRQSDDYYA